MRIETNISEVVKKLERIKAAFSGGQRPPGIDDAILSSLNSGMGLMKRRIFNNGEDALGNKLGNYHGSKTKVTEKKFSKTRYSIFGPSVSIDQEGERLRKTQRKNLKGSVASGSDLTEYEKYRMSRGRQIQYKDMELEGSLRRNIEVVKEENGRVVIAITNPENAKIAAYQEQQVGNIRAGAHPIKGSAEPAKIFILSREEFEMVSVEGKRAISQVVKNLFDQ